MLARSNLIHLTNFFAKQAKHFDANLVPPFDARVNLLVNGHPYAVHPFQQLEQPAQGGTTCRLMDVIGQRVVLPRSFLPETTLGHRRDQERQGHHHQEPLHTRGCFHTQRRDKKQRVLEKS